MQDETQQLQKLYARCWADDAFKQSLIADPANVLREAGVDIPADVSVSVVENTDTLFHLVIPQPPPVLSDVDLDSISGGVVLRRPRG